MDPKVVWVAAFLHSCVRNRSALPSDRLHTIFGKYLDNLFIGCLFYSSA
jgi:hypothetical protein